MLAGMIRDVNDAIDKIDAKEALWEYVMWIEGGEQPECNEMNGLKSYSRQLRGFYEEEIDEQRSHKKET